MINIVHIPSLSLVDSLRRKWTTDGDAHLVRIYEWTPTVHKGECINFSSMVAFMGETTTMHEHYITQEKGQLNSGLELNYLKASEAKSLALRLNMYSW